MLPIQQQQQQQPKIPFHFTMSKKKINRTTIPHPSILLLLTLALSLPSMANGQFSFCIPLATVTWEGLVQAIADSYRLAVLCPFEISGDRCPSPEEYPEGWVLEGGNEMIIECDPDSNSAQTQCIIDCPGRHFTVRGDSRLILTSIVLSGATNTSVYVEQGGALEVVDTKFSSNSAGSLKGGAIVAQEDAVVQVEYSTFHYNDGLEGGAIFAQGSTVHLQQAEFLGNEAIVAGGALAMDAGTLLEISDSKFNDNVGSSGGAIYLAEFGEMSISRTTFEKNAALLGGAIFNGGVATIDECSFFENLGVEGGGAISLDVGSSTFLVRNTLVNNGSGGYGPAVYDRYNVGVEIQENSACGNKVTIEGSVATSRCDGVYAFVGRRRATCLPFAHECIAPTPPPSLSPTKAPTVPTNVPSVKPSVAPSRSPTQQPSTYPTLSPSYIPSASIMPTVGPSPDPSQKSTSSPSSGTTPTPTISSDYIAFNISESPTYFPSNDTTAGPSLTHSPSPQNSSETTMGPSVSPTPFLTFENETVTTESPSDFFNDTSSPFPSGMLSDQPTASPTISATGRP